MTRSNLLPIAALIATNALALSGCGGSSSPPNKSTLSISLADAPLSGVSEVDVTVTGVEVQPTDGQAISFNLSQAQKINLLTFQSGTVFPLVDRQLVPAGQYQWIRLMLDTTTPHANQVVVATGSNAGTYDLKIPSGAETGLKLIQGFTMPANGAPTHFVIDFVASKSIVSAGNSGQWLLKPVLRMVDVSASGTIAGTISAALAAAPPQTTATTCSQANPPAVYVYVGSNATPDDIYTGTETDSGLVEPLTTQTTTPKANGAKFDFTYSIPFLPAGTYTVAFTCDPDDPSVDESAAGTIHFTIAPTPAVVTNNTTTTVNF